MSWKNINLDIKKGDCLGGGQMEVENLYPLKLMMCTLYPTKWKHELSKINCHRTWSGFSS